MVRGLGDYSGCCIFKTIKFGVVSYGLGLYRLGCDSRSNYPKLSAFWL